jgi:hypothetical protein
VDEAEFHTTVRHFYLEEEAGEVHFAFAFFVAAAAVAAAAVFSFAAAAAVVVQVVVVVVVVAIVESSFFEELGVHRPFFGECDLLAVHPVHLVHPVQPCFQYSTDLTFVVLRRIMLRYYSLIIIYNLNNILFLYYFRIFILIVSWHI